MADTYTFRVPRLAWDKLVAQVPHPHSGNYAEDAFDLMCSPGAEQLLALLGEPATDQSEP